MVLSLWMSSGRTMPATISSRTSKLTRISCLPSTTRLPFGSSCVTTAATLVCSAFLALHRALAVAGGGGVRGQDAAGQHLCRGGAQRLGADEVGDPGIFLVGAAALGLVGEVGLVGDVDGDGQEVADLVRALVLEERARAVPPQRIGVVGHRFRLRHRHLHRLVAGLRRRIFDRRQLRLFADLRQPVDRRASAGERTAPSAMRR